MKAAPKQDGVICMPLLRNVPVGRPGWTLTTCPTCGAKCWTDPYTDSIRDMLGIPALCTMCGLKYGKEAVHDGR